MQPIIIRPLLKAEAKEIYRRNFSTLFIAALIVGLTTTLLGYALSLLFPAQTFEPTLGMNWQDMMTGFPWASSAGFSLLSFVLSLIITAPLTFGYYELCLSAHAQNPSHFSEIFTWFGNIKHFGTAIRATLWLSVLAFLYMLPIVLVFAVGAIVAAAGGVLAESVLIPLLVIILVIVLLVFILAKLFCFTAANYAVAENPEMPVIKTFSKVGKMMSPYKWQFFSLYLSFIGWAFLAAIVAGIFGSFSPFLMDVAAAVTTALLSPYVTLSLIGFFKKVRGETMSSEEGFRPEGDGNL